MTITYRAILVDPDEFKTLKERIAELEQDNERLHDVLQSVQNFMNAYPVDIFPEPDFAQVRALLAIGGVSLDCVSASNMRNVLNWIKNIMDEVPPPQPPSVPERGG